MARVGADRVEFPQHKSAKREDQGGTDKRDRLGTGGQGFGRQHHLVQIGGDDNRDVTIQDAVEGVQALGVVDAGFTRPGSVRASGQVAEQRGFGDIRSRPSG